ncbi:hypothetical protein EG329_007230 [Mollisiaceae sp. DMI_Dod_QoI]|nr:hypothetical protein EG329_007230 [Helotiales sp. DMI_Dod_QoI]
MSSWPIHKPPLTVALQAQFTADGHLEVDDDVQVFDKKVHDFDTTIKRSPPESSPLSNLPSELREQIYGLVFHDYTSSQYCKDPHIGLGNRGCRCGKGLSLANYLFYNETRALYYQCARFVFTRPEACDRFVSLGWITKYIGNLSIAYNEEYLQQSLLRPIFNDLIYSSSLQTLHLRITNNENLLYRRAPPTYMPTVDKTWKAMKYDISMRPVRHPLATLRCLRSLTVQGNPGIEIEEAIHKLSLRIENLAKEERNAVQTKGLWRSEFYEWFYEIKIVE